jgi:multidrug efflux pump subunit AcrB
MNNIIEWFIKNPIAANLLMVGLLTGGWFGTDTIKKEVFPTSDKNFINVNMSYLGAAPSEVEQQIVIRIEEAIAGLPGIFKITSNSRQDSGSVSIEVIEGYNVKDVLSDVKARVDAINTFPPSSERPIISQLIFRNTLMWFAISGDVSRSELKKIGYQIRDEMPLLEGVSEVNIQGLRLDEVSIEISENNLRRYSLTFDEVAAAIRHSSMNVPAGAIKTQQGSIQIQTRAQAYKGQDFADIIVRSNIDGSQLFLSDIAQIKDGFTEQEIDFIIGTKPGLNFEVKMSDDPKLFKGTVNAHNYLDALKKTLPQGLTLKINNVSKDLFDDRFNLLKDNALSGLILVFIILMLFLRPLLAIWVVVGIVTAFAGAVWLLPYFGISLNMLSMFAFLLVLGIVVDDAIIVGESIYSQQQKGVIGDDSAIIGAKSVLMPVVLAVLSTIIFFMPMVDVPIAVEPYTISIFFVVCFCLLFSLAESLLILPSHLSHMKADQPSRFVLLIKLERTRQAFSSAMERFAAGTYRSVLNKFLKRKGSTVLAFIMLFALSLSMFNAGWLKTSFFPRVPQAFIYLQVSFPEGSPYRYTTDLAEYMKKHASSLDQNPELLAKNGGKTFLTEVNTTSNGSHVDMFVGLTPAEQRSISVETVRVKLKELIGPLPEVQSYSLISSFGGNNPDIQLNLSLSSNAMSTQQQAVNDIKKMLVAYDGIENVRSNLDTGRLEVELDLKNYAQTLGITTQDISSQVRQAFYGEEVQRIPRSKEDVRVMLRFPENERGHLDTLDDMRIRTAQGEEVPLEAVANIKLVPGSSMIRRTDRIRNITITADTLEGADGHKIITQMLASYGEKWKKQYSGFELSPDGNLRAQAEFGDNFSQNFLFAFIIAFSLFAIAFKSIFEPMLILIAVPFGFMGAIFGHIIWSAAMGTHYDISMMSFFGFLACSGVVVNDNLVLLQRINYLRARGDTAFESVLNAGTDRFRPIVLTSLTTFAGLLPILFERSTQAQFLIPMVISLAFGVLFASVVTLVMIPCAYLGGHSAGQRIKRLTRWTVNKLDILAPSAEVKPDVANNKTNS